MWRQLGSFLSEFLHISAILQFASFKCVLGSDFFLTKFESPNKSQDCMVVYDVYFVYSENWDYNIVKTETLDLTVNNLTNIIDRQLKIIWYKTGNVI